MLVPEFNEQGVACYRLDGGDYLNEYYILSEAETRKLLTHRRWSGMRCTTA